MLGVRPVGIDENFFELGGHSLLAAKLFAAIERRYARQLSLATLFRAPTVERLANVLRQDGPPAPASALVPIRAGGSRPPLFCLHQNTGHLFCYQDLARHLGPDQPVYGLAPPSLDGRQTPPPRIEAMAAQYLHAIRSVQPQGPYHLAGYSFGGTVVFEMASQLRARGEAVGLVALIETSREAHATVLGRAIRRGRRRATYEWDAMAGLSASERIGHMLARGLTLGEEQAVLLRKWCRKGLRKSRGRESSLDRADGRLEAALAAASRRYAPKVFPGRIVLFRGGPLPARHYGDQYLGWGGLADKGIVVEEIPGRWRTIVEDVPARLVAERLTWHLAAGPKT